MEAIVAEARSRGILVIEDCALSVGSSLDGRQVGTFGDAAIFSMELSKTMSCGWGGILVVNDGKLATAVKRLYDSLPERGRWASTRDLWQTAVSAWCCQPALYALPGKYILFLGFRSGLFHSSTPKPEYEGQLAADFMVRMAGPQAALASRQWRDLPAIAAACERNAQQLRTALGELRVTHPGAPEAREVSIAPRVSFLVNDRQEAFAYFRAAGVELGAWFDGPMSPVPRASVFNYKLGGFPNAEGIARNVVNLPCHSRIDAADLTRIETTLRAYVRERLSAR
jgi:dTDP-4-amino-4,6-dideoxygalactose transaminase